MIIQQFVKRNRVLLVKIKQKKRRNTMKTHCIRLLPLYLVALLTVAIVTGCAQSYNLGLVKPDQSGSSHEITTDNYKVKIIVTPITEDHQYVCSIKLFNKNDNAQLKEIESKMGIKKYQMTQINSKQRTYTKNNYIGGIIPTLNTSTMKYEFKYELKSKGKYDLNIEVSKIDGKILDKDILISFEQEVK
jgi:hypothetical protein